MRIGLQTSLIILFLILSADSSYLFSQSCDECSRPRIALYDSDIQAAFPSTPDSIIQWYSLFWPSAVSNSRFMNNDVSKSCINYYDGAVINSAALQGNVLKFGNGYSNLPPAGEIASVDYLFVSSIVKNGNGFTLTLQLQASVSREIVKSISVNFTSDIASEQQAGQTAADAFIPVFTTIRDWELNKRSTDMNVAIKDLWNKNTPDDIIVKPKNSTAGVGDTVDVEITLLDCDGAALHDRLLYLHEITINGNDFPGSVNGHFTQETVTTNEEGKANVKFVPDAPGLAVMQVNFPHKKPNGRNYGFVGTAYLNIPHETEKISVVWNFKQSTVGDYDTTIVSSNGSNQLNGHLRLYYDEHFRVKGLVERDYSITDNKVYNNILSMTVTGSGSGNKTSRKQDWLSTENFNGVFSAEIITNNSKTKFEPPITDCSIQYPSPDNQYLEAGLIWDITGHETGTNKTYDFASGWSSYDFDYPFTLSRGPNFGQPQPGRETIELTDTTFTMVHYYEEVNDADEDPNFYLEPILHSRWLWDWNCKIDPYTNPAGVENENDIPKSFKLEQNYPNPFNPSTRINYSVPKAGNVVLKVYDVLGRETAALVNEYKTPGNYSYVFNASKLTSGVYFYRLTCGSYVNTKKLILVK
jgi:hypothetical protein